MIPKDKEADDALKREWTTENYQACSDAIVKTSNPKDRIGITKLPLHILPIAFLVDTALALFDGLCKYGRFNWRKESVAATVYIDAAQRHIAKWAWGREKDKDSGVHELGHAAACLAILMDAQASGNLVDDREKDEKMCVMIDEAQEEVKRLLTKHGKAVPDTPPINAHAGLHYKHPDFVAEPPAPVEIEQHFYEVLPIGDVETERPVKWRPVNSASPPVRTTDKDRPRVRTNVCGLNHGGHWGTYHVCPNSKYHHNAKWCAGEYDSTKDPPAVIPPTHWFYLPALIGDA